MVFFIFVIVILRFFYTSMITKLEDIATILSGTYRQEIPDGDLLYLQVKDFTASHLSKGKLAPTVLDGKGMQKHVLQDYDLLFASKGTSNFCVIYRENMGRAVASTSFFIIRLIANIILPEYLCWYINTPPILKSLQAKAVGGLTLSISKENLMDLEINVPDIKKQELIIKCAKLQAEAYELERKILEKKNQIYIQTLLKATK